MSKPLLLVLLLAACTPTRSPPVDRNGTGTTLGSACSNLRELGCPEGFDNHPNGIVETCFEHLTRVATVTTIPDTCLADAGSIDAARTCGDPNTLRVRCLNPDAGASR